MFSLYAFEMILVGEADVWFFGRHNGSGHRRQFPIFLLFFFFKLITNVSESESVSSQCESEEKLSVDKMARMTVTAGGDLLFLLFAKKKEKS